MIRRKSRTPARPTPAARRIIGALGTAATAVIVIQSIAASLQGLRR